MSGGAASASPIRWRSDVECEIDGVSYASRPLANDLFESTATTFCIAKPRWAIEAIEALLARHHPATIFEVGMLTGGSTALLAQLAAPRRLVSVDIKPHPIRGLADFIATRGLTEVVRPHYGVDQADSARLREVAAIEFGDGSLDLVIDDASHYRAETTATFNALFGLLRPGGYYLIEDWSWPHVQIDVWPDQSPLSLLVFELIIACGHHPEMIAAVEIDRGWALVRRGDAPIDLPDGGEFALRDLLGSRGAAIMDRIGEGNAEPQRRRFGRSR